MELSKLPLVLQLIWAKRPPRAVLVCSESLDAIFRWLTGIWIHMLPWAVWMVLAPPLVTGRTSAGRMLPGRTAAVTGLEQTCRGRIWAERCIKGGRLGEMAKKCLY